ncbi:HAD family phosphatase [Parabacteroides sp. PF5-9]|uniref:HAD family hydrolase n=1 Tax=Parabacteroides sp. PF5-9 TaxID=1742404 RepID=UPI002473906D|nr:HAD family phosphatase [Parabacteroides sp. PF5-9]MDH6358626.1 beta-phosphoglucomutase [Parabacteroides sp. PF5-9]
MSYTGVVFDFNGTLFWDTPLHNEAWNIFLKKRGLHLSDHDFFTTIHGKNNKDIFTQLFHRDFSAPELKKLIDEKEDLYRQLCLKTEIKLAPGVIDFLNFLQTNKTPFTIATASDKENLDFYFQHLGLSKWFDYDKVVYNNGKIKSKPDPEIYQIAMSVIGIAPEKTVVFEDAVNGLLAAQHAQAGCIIAVNSNNDDYSLFPNYQAIHSFDEVDRHQFLHD